MAKNLLLFIFLVFGAENAIGNIVGTDLQNFNPTSSGLDFVTVHSSDTLEPGTFNIGTFFNYATNSLPYFKFTTAPSGQKFLEPNDSLIANDFHLGFGISKGWDVGVSLSSILRQAVDNSGSLGTFSEKGLTDLRINSKVRIFKGEHKDMDTGLALVGSIDFDRVINNPFNGDNAGPTVNLEAVWDSYLTNFVRFGLNLGYRFRSEGETIPNTGVTPVTDQLTYSSALALLYDPWTLMFEIFGSTPLSTVETPTDRKMHNLQALAGLRWKYSESLDFHGGVGRELYHGLASPDVLIYLGVNWRFGTRSEDVPAAIVEPAIGDEDQDGVLDDKDRCPGTPIGTPVNEWGCDLKRVEDFVLKDLNFKYNSAELTAASRKKVNKMIDKLLSHPGKIERILVEGHTDSKGSENYNLRLSQRRAETIATLLRQRLSIPVDKISTEGKGESYPLDSNDTESGRARNRRVEINVIHARST